MTGDMDYTMRVSPARGAAPWQRCFGQQRPAPAGLPSRACISSQDPAGPRADDADPSHGPSCWSLLGMQARVRLHSACDGAGREFSWVASRVCWVLSSVGVPLGCECVAVRAATAVRSARAACSHRRRFCNTTFLQRLFWCIPESSARQMCAGRGSRPRLHRWRPETQLVMIPARSAHDRHDAKPHPPDPNAMCTKLKAVQHMQQHAGTRRIALTCPCPKARGICI